MLDSKGQMQESGDRGKSEATKTSVKQKFINPDDGSQNETVR